MGGHDRGRRSAAWTAASSAASGRGRPGRRSRGPRLGRPRSLRGRAKGALWVGTAGAGLFRYADGRFRRYSTARRPPRRQRDRHLPRRQGRPLDRHQRRGPRPLRERAVDPPSRSRRAAPGTSSSPRSWTGRGALWAGTDGGGTRPSGERRSSPPSGAPTAWPSDIVFTLHEDTLGTLWIGTSGGLSCYRDGQVPQLHSPRGLLDEVVFRDTRGRRGEFLAQRQQGRLPGGPAGAGGAGPGGDACGLAHRLRHRGRDEEQRVQRHGQPRGLEERATAGSGSRPPAAIVVIDPARIAPQPRAAARARSSGWWWTGSPSRPGRSSGKAALRLRVHRAQLPRPAQACASSTGSRGTTRTGWRRARQRTAHYTRLPPGRYTFRVAGEQPRRGVERRGRRPHRHPAPVLLADRVVPGIVRPRPRRARAMAYRLRVSTLRAHRRELEALVEERTRDLVAETARVGGGARGGGAGAGGGGAAEGDRGGGGPIQERAPRASPPTT